jgi:DNA-directed RNA polymerase specialized sigma24 family protein
MTISRWKPASRGHTEAGPRGSSRADWAARPRFLTGSGPREGRTLPSRKATDAGQSGSGPSRREISDAGGGDTLPASTDAEQLLLRWQEQGDREAWDRLADIAMRAARRWSVAHRGRLRSRSVDPDDVGQEALLRFVQEADHIHPYSIHGLIKVLIDRSAVDLNRRACRAKRGGGGAGPAPAHGTDDGDCGEGEAYSSDSPAHSLATQEGLRSGVCFDESEMFYIRRAFEAYSGRADEPTARAWRLAELLSNDTHALAEGLGCSERTIMRRRADLRSQLERGLHSLRDEYRSAGKNDDALAVTELMQKLDKVATVRMVKRLAVRR